MNYYHHLYLQTNGNKIYCKHNTFMLIIKNDLQNYFYVKFMQYFQVMAGINHILNVEIR